MFRIMLLSFWTLTHAYVFGRLSGLPVVRRVLPRPAVLAVGAVLWALWFLGDEDSASALRRGLRGFSMDWLGAIFLIAAALLAADLLTGFGFLFRRAAPIARGFGLLAGAGLAVLALVQGARAPVISEHEIRLPGLPEALDGTTVAVLSDLHLGSRLGPEWLAGVAAQVEAMRPDLILFLGDTVEAHGRPDGDLRPGLSRFRAPLGVYAVAGNHEGYGDLRAAIGVQTAAGFVFLHERAVEVAPGLVVAGVDDPVRRARDGRTGGFAEQALVGRPRGATIFLSHAAREVEVAAEEGVGLMLSGHTHGGQIWPFSYLNRLTTPWVEGRFTVDGMTLLVTRGTGTWGPRMRLFAPAEILRLTLRAP